MSKKNKKNYTCCIDDYNTSKSIAKYYRIAFLIMIGIFFLNKIDFFILNQDTMKLVLLLSAVLLIPTITVEFLHFNFPLCKYLLITISCYYAGLLYVLLGNVSFVMFAFPFFLTCLYFDEKLTKFTLLMAEESLLIAKAYLLYKADVPKARLEMIFNNDILPVMLELLLFAFISTLIIKRNKQMIKNIKEQNTSMLQMQTNMIASFAEMEEFGSEHTGKHIKRVHEFVSVLSKAVGYSEDETFKLASASMMHDIGKSLIPQSIINKPEKLTKEEYALVKKHTQYGEDLLKGIKGDIMEIATIMAKQHHERWDGSGYYGMIGKDIHIYGRIMAIVDVFDALIGKRPYKESWDLEDAKNEIIRGRGSQFDPELVDLFLQNFEQFKIISLNNLDS